MGGGGDDGYEARQAATEAKKQAARDALNAQFGIVSDSYKAKQAPSKLGFIRPGRAGQMVFGGGGEANETNVWDAGGPEVVDEDGYARAKSAYDGEMAQAQTAGQDRDALYQSVRDNAFTAGKRRLDEQNQDAGRKLKFELFAKGQNGGSEDINQNALRKRIYDQGIMDLGAKADSAKAQFRGDDENARLGLLQAIDSGTDQGSAISSAMNQLKVNADKAAGDANGTTLGDLFNNGELLYNKSQQARGKAAGTEWWNNYQTGSSGKGGTARTGQITTV